MARLEMDGVTKQFGDLTAVKGMDLTIRDGEFIVFVGPSGCGKSTTLRMVSGLESITEGNLSIDGTVVNDMSPSERSVAMVFQNYALYPHMTARRNITFGIKSSTDFGDEEIEQRVDDTAEMLDITDLLDRKPAQLSGGERQRVAIARALVRDPEVFLLDEPLSNLDAKLRIQMRAELAELHKEIETTTVYVTHDQTEAMTLGDRVAVMNEGSIQQVGPPQEIHDYPQNRFVAEFIGDPSMNMLPVDLERNGDEYRVHGETFEIDLGAVREDLAEGDQLLGIRPEDIYLSSDRNGTASIPLTVRVTETLGDEQLIYGNVGDTEIRFKIDARLPVEDDSQIDIVFDPDRLHIFDPATGDALYHSLDTAEVQTEAVR